MNKTWRMVKDWKGEHFLEVPDKYWDEFLEAWKRDHTHPAPVPAGHRMFQHPKEYQPNGVMHVDEDMLVAACREENAKAKA